MSYLSLIPPLIPERTHFYQFIPAAACCRHQLNQIRIPRCLTQKEHTPYSVPYFFFFSHNPKYWCSLSLCVALTTVVANGAVTVEIKNTESLQMTSLAAGNTCLPKVDIRFKSHNREPVFLTKEVLRKCCTAPQRRPEMG